jgi:hypothetical protein
MDNDFKALTATRKELREAGYFHTAKLIVLRELSPQKRKAARTEDPRMPIFKPELLKKILEGTKTQTRRPGKQRYREGRRYGVRSSRFKKSEAHIVITRSRREKLGDISREDAKKEGFSNVEEFQTTWRRIYRRWNPTQIVTVYDFELAPETYNPEQL